mgnify:CR=1 FL=1
MLLPEKNLLGEQASPYLLQHRDNPVHWRPWSRDALDEARELNRPILLSVGYAACHWCHVMAHECFEDNEVAELMNSLFVNIKVDREERPDIDQIYMTALSAMGEQGGWPLTMFLTPEAKPFWGGTYFPKRSRYGRPGFIDVLNAVHSAWQTREDELLRSADTLSIHVRTHLAPMQGTTSNEVPLRALAEKIRAVFDPQLGGLRGAPKFPNAPFLDLLWLNWLENGAESDRDTVLLTLRSMLAGGIYDHVGGGLARYSVDAQWLVPHFEKMLYDNAQLIRLCSYAYGGTHDRLFRIRIEDTIKWLLREMTVEGGGFASSLDADSEGEEGKFYLWTRAEIEDVLGVGDARELLAIYDLANPEEWEGNPILHRRRHPEVLDDSSEQRLRTLLDRLTAARGARTRPGRDDKVLVDWNGLAIAAIAVAGRQFARPEWIEAAARAFRFVLESMEEGRLPHSIRGEKRLFPALSSDYAAMISAAIALYGATHDDGYVDQARQWLDRLDAWYLDDAGSGYFLTAFDSADTPMRIRGDMDDPIPSATGQIVTALVHLATVSGSDELYQHAVRVSEAALARAQNQAYGQLGIICAAALAQRPMKLLINDPAGETFIPVANQIPDPRRVDIIVGLQENAAERDAGVKIDRSTAGAWLCTGQICLPPIHNADSLAATLRTPHQCTNSG